MSPNPPSAHSFADVLETSRRFLLALANARLPPGLRAKGGASDLVQETIVAAYEARHQFRGQTLPELLAWLRAILTNELAMFRRHYTETAARDVSREVPLAVAQTEVTHTTAIAELLRHEDECRLEAAIAELPDESRQAVVLRAECGLCFAAIGEQLGRTEEAARKLFTRALNRLREMTREPRD